jgi:lipoprotein NlpI
MSILSRIGGLFSRSGRDEDQLRQAMDHAKNERPKKAIEIYTALIDSKGTSADVRARALFNRALAHSSLNHDDRALIDLTQVLAQPNLAEAVQIAARSQLTRVKKRAEKRAG